MTATRSGNLSSASSVPAGDEHGDALDHGAECRHPHARPLDCVHAPEREAAERRAAEDATRALALLLEHGVLGYESLSVCVM